MSLVIAAEGANICTHRKIVDARYMPAKPLHNRDIVSVHFKHFYCMEICDKLSRHLSMLTYIYLNVCECSLTPSMVFTVVYAVSNSTFTNWKKKHLLCPSKGLNSINFLIMVKCDKMWFPEVC